MLKQIIAITALTLLPFSIASAGSKTEEAQFRADVMQSLVGSSAGLAASTGATADDLPNYGDVYNYSMSTLTESGGGKIDVTSDLANFEIQQNGSFKARNSEALNKEYRMVSYGESGSQQKKRVVAEIANNINQASVPTKLSIAIIGTVAMETISMGVGAVTSKLIG